MQRRDDNTLDAILDGRVKILQRRRGYRCNQDTLHLCQFVRAMPEARGIDLGTGSGVIAIVLVREGKIGGMVGLELQRSLVALAERNVVLNRLVGRVEVVWGDIRRVRELFVEQSFQLVVSNPPYRELGSGRFSPCREKMAAKHEQTCTLQDLIEAARYLVAPTGVFCFCHLRTRWTQIQRLLLESGMEVRRKQVILGPHERPTGSLMVEAIKT